MAVKLITSIKRYVGLSTDVKPVAPIGSTFFEADTGLLKVLDGDENWNNKKSIIGIDPAANAVQLSKNKLEEQKTQANAVANVITFTGDINAIEIYHEEATWQDFTVNGITLKIPSGGYRTPIGGTVAKTVTIPANVDCIVGRLE